jgi:hypothetical protein
VATEPQDSTNAMGHRLSGAPVRTDLLLAPQMGAWCLIERGSHHLVVARKRLHHGLRRVLFRREGFREFVPRPSWLLLGTAPGPRGCTAGLLPRHLGPSRGGIGPLDAFLQAFRQTLLVVPVRRSEHALLAVRRGAGKSTSAAWMHRSPERSSHRSELSAGNWGVRPMRDEPGRRILGQCPRSEWTYETPPTA